MSSLVERLLKYTGEPDENGCWLWTGGTTHEPDGRVKYGKLGESIGGGKVRYHLAHRLSYEHHVGSIPGDLTIDHLCRVKLCVNPAHMEPVPIAENVRRAADVNWPGRRDPAVKPMTERSHCKNGHEFTEENTLWHSRPKRRSAERVCRTCWTEKSRANRARWAAQRAEKRKEATDMAGTRIGII